MDTKFCKSCDIEKPVSGFSKAAKHKGCRLGLRGHCKACASQKSLVRARKNPDRVAAYRKEYYQKNADLLREKSRIWAKENNHRRVINETLRQRVRSEQTPPWADHDAIRAIYERAAQIRAIGLNVHVDHIVPLKSDSVCGLHCETNLDIVYSADNVSKGNHWWPGDFEHQGWEGMYG